MIESFSWASFDLARMNNAAQLQEVKFSDIGRVDYLPMGLYGVSPDIFNCLESKYT